MAYRIACMIPDPLEHPTPVGYMGRKVGKDFKTTTLETWKRFIPTSEYKIKGDPAVITIRDRVKILTGGLDRSEDVQKFNSAELAFFFLDQAEEVDVDDIMVLRACLRLQVNGKPLDYKGLFTANPRQCWLKDEFILNPTSDRKFVQALPGDNPLLPETYLDTLKDSFKHRPELLRAYLYGDWSALQGPDQVFKDEWINDAGCRSAEHWPFIKQYIAVDVARFGDDETVILIMNNTEIIDKIVVPHSSVEATASRIYSLVQQHDQCQVAVETTGGDLGAGVIDVLRSFGAEVIEYWPQGKTTVKGFDKKDIYGNLRAEAWSEAAKAYASGVIGDGQDKITVVCRNMYAELRNQLTIPTYKFRKGKTLIESKDDIKKRLHRSPDHADAYIIALWAYPYIRKVTEKPTSYRKKQREKAANSAMKVW